MKKFSITLLLCIGLSMLTVFAEDKNEMSLKTINYRDAVSFSIPSHWKEEDEKGVQGTYYEDLQNTGTLRVSVLEWKSETESERNEKLQNAILPGNIETLAQGVYLKAEVKEGFEDGEKLSLYRWLVALALPENLFRLVTFTHTIVEGQESESKIKKELEVINSSLRSASYSYETNLKIVDKF